jgi:hypothetical protein
VNPDTSLPDGITGWTLRIVWPIEDEAMFNSEAIGAARALLPETSRALGAIVVGEPSIRIVEADPNDTRITTPTVVVCTVDAVPTWYRWPEIVEELAGKGWSDPQLARLLHVKTERIRGIRRRHGIPAGVTAGWSSINADRYGDGSVAA